MGTEYLPHVLSEYGLHQFAGDILQKDDCPSWLYSVKLGATTIWELWDGVNEDHSFNMFTMNSLNQYGFATIGDWMVKRLAGISPLAPGYRKSRIAPQLVRGIPGVEASYETPYGRLARMTADIEIPANATAEVALPGQAVKTLGSGRYHFEYETALSFEATKYSEDSTLKQLMADPDARAYFEEMDPKLARDPMVLNFAGRASILEIKKTMPNTMVPTSAYPIFDESKGERKMKLAIGNDHVAVDMKNEIKEYLESKGIEVINVGTDKTERFNYPVAGYKVARMVAQGAYRTMTAHNRCLRQFESIIEALLVGMTQVHHQSQTVHLGDDLSAKGADTTMCLTASCRVADIIIAIMTQGDIDHAALLEMADIFYFSFQG